MQFRQPNSLVRAMHLVLNDLVGGQTISLCFGSEAEIQHVLEALREVAASRSLTVSVRASGSRTLELSLAGDAG